MSHGTDADQKDLGPSAGRGARRWTTVLTFVVAIGGVLAVALMRQTATGHPRRAQRSVRVASHRHPSPRSPRRPRSTSAIRATVRLAPDAPAVAIPHSFLGFSTEYWTLPVDERHVALYRRVIALLHNPGDGRFVLRIGGVSSDHSFWQLAVRRMPDWGFGVTPRWIARTARIVRQSRLRLIIDLNLITATPALNAALAREAVAALPRGSIAAFEIGNEPDVYDRQVWGVRLAGSPAATGRLPSSLTADSYVASFDADARSLGVVAPRVPLQGPALANPRLNVNWISRLLAGPRPRLDAISVHEYPYTACARPDAPAYPTIQKLLSFTATSSMVRAVGPAMRLARRAAFPVRVSEFNSVTCGGVAGVSNSFASALWVPSALFALIRAGVSSADLHVRAYSINAPFRFGRKGVTARPLLYGLILFARMVGPGSRLLRVQVRGPAGAAFHVWAVSQPGRHLSVLLIDPTARPMKVNLMMASRRRATVERLLAPSPWATSGETLDGQRLGAGLRWHGRRQLETASPHHGSLTVTVSPMSAAVVTVRLRRGSATRQARCRGCGRLGLARSLGSWRSRRQAE